MKKLTLLLCLVSLISVSSCSSDDDGGSSDPVIGTWKAYKSFEDGEEVELSDCYQKYTATFSSDGTCVFESYDEDYDGNCELDIITGTWENMGDSFYKITHDVDEQGDEENEGVIEVHFEDNTMYMEEVYEDVVYKDVFIKQ